MVVLIWILVPIFLSELVYGESNPYREALNKHPWDSVQDYVYVRPGAYMFYWLYYADGTRVKAESKPLIIFIQGGGLAVSGIANFAEIGPLTMDFEPRNHTWAKGRNLLLIDDPVGTGFSVATRATQLVTTDEEIANDLYITIQKFFYNNSPFRTTPTYIFGQGFGGKICPMLAYRIHQGMENKEVDFKLEGIGIGGGFVDMRESFLVYPDYLYTVGLIGYKKYLETTTIAKRVRISIDKKNYAAALKLVETVLFEHEYQRTNRTINPYHVFKTQPFSALEVFQKKINTYVKPVLASVVDQALDYHYLSRGVYERLNKTFLVPSTNYLEMLLNRTNLKIAIYNGNLDIITPVAGATAWAHKLNWHGAKEFKSASRHPIRGMNNGIYKEARQLSFWWVLGAGHWVPEDNPEAMQHILDHLAPIK